MSWVREPSIVARDSSVSIGFLGLALRNPGQPLWTLIQPQRNCAQELVNWGQELVTWEQPSGTWARALGSQACSLHT